MEGSRISHDEVRALTADQLPWAVEMGLTVETLEYGRAIVRLPHSASYLRPGGTVSGPAMMTLADFSLYIAVLSAIGREELAVTSQLSINFLRKPRPADLLADTRMIRIGRRLAYGEVFLYSDGADGAREGPGEPVAHVTGSYALPAPPR